MDKKIYLLYSCDEWKSHDSMRLVMGSVCKDKIREQLIEEIKDKNMEYDANISDIENLNLYMINTTLEYGHIKIIDDGELQ